jgi:hypothetical protein
MLQIEVPGIPERPCDNHPTDRRLVAVDAQTGDRARRRLLAAELPTASTPLPSACASTATFRAAGGQKDGTLMEHVPGATYPPPRPQVRRPVVVQTAESRSGSCRSRVEGSPRSDRGRRSGCCVHALWRSPAADLRGLPGGTRARRRPPSRAVRRPRGRGLGSGQARLRGCARHRRSRGDRHGDGGCKLPHRPDSARRARRRQAARLNRGSCVLMPRNREPKPRW